MSLSYCYTEFLITNISTEGIPRKCFPVKESNIFVGNVANNFLRRDSLLNTKCHYMKESIILVGNVAYNSLRIEVLQDTKGQCMRESNILVGNAANNFLRR